MSKYLSFKINQPIFFDAFNPLLIINLFFLVFYFYFKIKAHAEID